MSSAFLTASVQDKASGEGVSFLYVLSTLRKDPSLMSVLIPGETKTKSPKSQNRLLPEPTQPRFVTRIFLFSNQYYAT